MAISWRNVDIGGAGAANALLANSAKQVTQGLDTLANVAAQQGQTQSANWDQAAQNNTNDVLAKLSTYTTTDALAKEIEGGQFSIDKLDSAFGRQYNKAAVMSAVDQRRTNLLALDKANKLAADAELNKKVTLEKANRIKQFDTRALSIMTETTDPNELQSRLWNVAKSINGDGIIPMSELSQTVDSVVNRVKGVGLDEASTLNLKLQQDQLPTVINEGTKAIDTELANFKAKGHYDDGVDRITSDQSSVADAMNMLRTQITEKGGDLPDTTKVASRIEELNQLFDSEGLPPPNGKMVYELLTQGGVSDGWFSDSQFRLNTDFTKNMIGKIKTNQLFKETNVQALMQFAQAKASITDTASMAVANNQSEMLRSARAKAFAGEVHNPQVIQMDSIREYNNKLLSELRRLSPAGRVDSKDSPNAPSPMVTPNSSAKTGGTSGSAASSSSSIPTWVPAMSSQ